VGAAVAAEAIEDAIEKSDREEEAPVKEVVEV